MLRGLPFELLSPYAETCELKIGAKPFMDRGYRPLQLTEELTGIWFSHTFAKAGRLAPIRLRTEARSQATVIEVLTTHLHICLKD
jgi:hypothetical protein